MEFCSIASGSSGNCIFVSDGSTHILIDAGISRKRIVENLHEIGIKPEELSGILLTHEHADHIKGVNVLARTYQIPIFATHGTANCLKGDRSAKPIPQELFHILRPDRSFALGDLTVNPFSISHDAAEPVAYRIDSETKHFAVVTDLGTYDQYTIDHLKDLDGLVLEANHDVCMLQVGRYPYPLKQRILGDRGHLSNERSGQLLCEILHDRMKHIMLGHLSKENNLAELAGETVKLEVTLSELDCRGEDLPIEIADREIRSEMKQL